MTDTGPPYPHPNPVPGSNGIGRFQIGISPIGDIPPFDYWLTVISQYANSPILTKLIGNLFDYLDQTANIDAFFDLIMNVDTAQGYGLDVWGRIVGVNRALQVPDVAYFGFGEALPGSLGFNNPGTPVYSPYLGFAEALPTADLFGEGIFGLEFTLSFPTTQNGGPFYGAGTPLTSTYLLSDEAYRTLIFAKAAANITDGSIPSINQILLNLFPHRGNCYVTEGTPSSSYFGFSEAGNTQPFGQGVFYDNETIGYMQMSYTFQFPLSTVELAIVEQSGVLPKPTGVSASVVIL